MTETATKAKEVDFDITAEDESSKKRFTQAEDVQIFKLRKEGKSWEDIAKATDRTVPSLNYRF